MEKLISEIYELKKEKEAALADIERRRTYVASLQANIDERELQLITKLKEAQIDEHVVGDIVAVRSFKTSFGYKSEDAVIQYLKENYNGNYIRTKVQESIDKRPLSKALKADETLKSALDSMIEEKVTEFVVVTTLENRAKMLEHMKDE